jgi:hypothetical protein
LEEETHGDTLQGSEEYEFQIFRGVKPSNKAGGDTTQDFTIDGYKIDGGAIYLGNSKIEEEPVVTNLDGVGGKASSRVLQRVEKLWEFPKTMRLTREIPAFKGASLEDIEGGAQRRSQRVSKDPKIICTDIEQWEDDRYMIMPLYSLNKAYTAKEAGGNVKFQEGEVVRVLARDEKTETWEVVDYEFVVLAKDLT